MEEIEIWKDVKGYEGDYKVSTFGNVKSFKRGRDGFVLKQSSNGHYLCVGLSINGKQQCRTVHSLVGEAFLGLLKHRKFVYHHKDHCKTNNSLSNLDIVTQRYNVTEYKEGFTSEYTGVNWNIRGKCWRASIIYEGKKLHLGSFKSEVEASLYYRNAVTSIENSIDVSLRRNKYTSKHNGVSYHKINRSWIATYNSKYIGSFKTETEAYGARIQHIENLK